MNKDYSSIRGRLLSLITPVAAGAAVFLSAIVALEWLLGTLTIARISEGFVPMAPATALCVMLLGLGMLVRTDRSVIARRASLFLIGAALLIGALLLVDSSLNAMVGAHLDLERLLTREQNSGMGFVIGRMSPLTAMILVLLSAGMTGWRLRKGMDAGQRVWAHVFGIASFLTAGLFLVGYAYGKAALFGQTITPVALPTAAALFLLSAALLFDGSDAVVHAMMKSNAIQDRIMRAIAPLIMFIILTTGWFFHLLAGAEIEPQEVIELYLTAVLAGAATVIATILMSRRMKADIEKASGALERANTEWSAAMDASNDIIYLLDIDRRLIRGNKMFYQMTHTEPTAVAGRNIADIVHPRGEATPCPVCRAQMEKRDAVVVMEADHPDNPAGRPIEIMVRIVRDKLDNPISIFMSLHDLTHEREMQQSRKKLEEQLRQSQKMEAIGQLAGGVAHDFNNMLSAIIGYGHLTLMKMPEDDPLRHNIDQILESSQRATVLVQSLLTFSRKQPIKMEHLELNAVLAQFEKFLARLLREDIELKTRYSGEGLTIMADRGQIEQVIMNLVTNARDAMPGKGELSIETKIAALDEGFAAVHGYGRTGKYAMISVTDTGAGMDERTKRRIFEPFFTTKAQGKGTGLGLATVYGIVKTHDGFINVYSEPGRGTAFHVYLPLGSSGAGATESVSRTPLPMKGGAETLLLAEDDASLRKMTSTVLRHMGYSVIEAENGREAVAKFLENKDAVQLVILDGIMPQMNGKEAYQKILSIASQVRCIFMSGYAEDVFTRDGILQTDVKFLSKPATPSALLHAVREVLDR